MVPRYVLIVGAPHSGKLRLVQGLLGSDSKELSSLDIDADSHGGLIIPYTVDTSYFSVKIKLLVDEFPDKRSLIGSDIDKATQLREWVNEFTSTECADLHEVLEGVILCVDMNTDVGIIQSLMEAIMPVKELLCNEDNEKVFALAATSSSEPCPTDLEIEDVVISYGVEFIDMRESGYNAFREKIGIDRVRELLATHQWPDMHLKHDYEKSKTIKANEMIEPLLDRLVKDEEISSITEDGRDAPNESLDQPLDGNLEHVFQKLKIAKGRAENMSCTEKEKYIQSVIDEVINFI